MKREGAANPLETPPPLGLANEISFRKRRNLGIVT